MTAQRFENELRRLGEENLADIITSVRRELNAKHGIDDFPLPDREGEVRTRLETVVAHNEQLQEATQELKGIREIREALVAAMVNVKVISPCSEKVLNRALAKTINQQVGARIADEIKIDDLRLPYESDPLYETGGFEGIDSIDRRVQYQYSHHLGALDKSARHYSIGEIRSASIEDIRLYRRISEETAYFAKAAFARPQEPREK